MRYRSSDVKDESVRFTRYYLDPMKERLLLQMAHEERRSVTNMVSVLLEEAIVQRQQALEQKILMKSRKIVK